MQCAPSLFVENDFQQRLRTCYADPRLWKGVNVLIHETQMNRWASRKSLICRIQGEPLLRSQPKPWHYLWEHHDLCTSCLFEVTPQQPFFRCFRCAKLIHYVCLMENSASQKIPICQACGAPSTQEILEREQEEAALNPVEGFPAEQPDRPEQTGLLEDGPPDIELRGRSLM